MPKPYDDPMLLPSFEGRRPDTLKLTLTGGGEFPAEVGEAHSLGEVVYLVVCCETSKVLHSDSAEGEMARTETLKVEHLGVFGDGRIEEAADLIRVLNREQRERKGQPELPLGESTPTD